MPHRDKPGSCALTIQTKLASHVYKKKKKQIFFQENFAFRQVVLWSERENKHVNMSVMGLINSI